MAIFRKKDKKQSLNVPFSWDSINDANILTVVEEMTSKVKPSIFEEPCFNPSDIDPETLILLVEDSPIMRDFYRRMLESFSFSVETINEDENEIRFISGEKPRVVLIDDAGKPEEAIKIAGKIRNNPHTNAVPVMLMLPSDIFKHFQKIAGKFTDICMPKTFTPSVLMPSLQSLLSS